MDKVFLVVGRSRDDFEVLIWPVRVFPNRDSATLFAGDANAVSKALPEDLRDAAGRRLKFSLTALFELDPDADSNVYPWHAKPFYEVVDIPFGPKAGRLSAIPIPATGEVEKLTAALAHIRRLALSGTGATFDLILGATDAALAAVSVQSDKGEG